MTTLNENLKQAKKSIKSNIKFMEYIKASLNSTDESEQNKGIWFAWFLNQYINRDLINNINEVIQEQDDFN